MFMRHIKNIQLSSQILKYLAHIRIGNKNKKLSDGCIRQF